MKKTPVFIHNPKAASTSIRNSIPAIRTPMDRTIHLSVRHPMVVKQIRAAEKPWVFMVLRHPYARFVSAFHYFKLPRKRTVQEFTMLEACITHADINDFVAGVNLKKIAKVCPHFERQKFFQRGGKVHQFLRMESLNDDFAVLCGNLGIKPVELAHRRSSPHKPWDELLNERSKKKLRNFYQPDFTLFYPDEI